MVGVVVQNTILGFGILHKAKLAPNHLRILAESSLVVVLSIKLGCELWLTFNRRANLVLANRWLVALSKQRIGHILHIREPGRVSLLFQLQYMLNNHPLFSSFEPR